MTKQLMFVPALLCIITAAASAQPRPPLTSVALFKVSPDKVEAFVAKGKSFVPVLDKLMSSGTVTGYGIDVDMLHVPGATNVAFWVSSPDFATLEKSEKELENFQKANAAMMAELRSLSDVSAHHDLIVQSLERKLKPAPAGAKPVSDFDQVTVKPGKLGEYLALMRKHEKPILDKLVDDGVIYGYSLDSEAVHTMKPGTVWQIVTMPDLGTKDKVRAAFREASNKLTEEERSKIDKQYEELIEPGSHRDSLSVSVVYKTK